MTRRVRKPRVRQTTTQGRENLTDVIRLERHLTRIFSSLATLLLRHGYGYGRVSRVAKIAFVEAATALNGSQDSKASIARIATLTGLTRLEVSRIVRDSRIQSIYVDSTLNRATRVADGWQRDIQFSDRNRRPKLLPFTSGRGGFGHLVKKYSGDIPVRAMFTEMKRLGMVRLTDKNAVSLIRMRPLLPKSTLDAVRAISPWVNVLAGADVSALDTNLSSTTEQLRIYFDSLPQALAATRELEHRRQSFIEGIEQLGTASNKIGPHLVTVSVAVAAAQPKRTEIGNSRRSRKQNEKQ